jgi:hypothetical protein
MAQPAKNTPPASHTLNCLVRNIKDPAYAPQWEKIGIPPELDF